MDHPRHQPLNLAEASPPLPHNPKLLTRKFFLLFMAHLFFGFAFWPYVLLPVFLQDLGSDLATVGMIMGTSSIAGIFIRPWIGVALDRIGRQACLILGGLAFLTAHLLYPSIHQIGWGIYVVRLFHGLGMGILIATFFTLAADISPASRRTEGIALFGISGHLSGAIGVPLGEQIVRISGYPALFNLSAGFTLLSLVTCCFLKSPVLKNKSAVFDMKHFLKTVIHPPNRVPLAATGLFALGLISYMVFLKPYVRTFGLGVSTFFLAYTLTAISVRLIGAKWPDRFGPMPVLYPALFSLSAGIILLALSPTPSGLIFGGVLCGIGHGFIFPILSVLLISRAPDSARGGRMTLFTLFFDLGLFAGAPLWGFVAKTQGYQTMFFGAATAVLIGIAAFALFDRSHAAVNDQTDNASAYPPPEPFD